MSESNHSLATQDLYRSMSRWQLIATAVVSVIAYILGGPHAMLSVLAGGLAVILGAFVASKIAERSKNDQRPSAVLINLLKAEAIKIVVIALMLLVVFKFYLALVPIALIAGLASAALFSGAALAKVKTPI